MPGPLCHVPSAAVAGGVRPNSASGCRLPGPPAASRPGPRRGRTHTAGGAGRPGAPPGPLLACLPCCCYRGGYLPHSHGQEPNYTHSAVCLCHVTTAISQLQTAGRLLFEIKRAGLSRSCHRQQFNWLEVPKHHWNHIFFFNLFN